MPEMDQDFDFATLAIAHKIVSREKVEGAQAVLQQEALAGKPPRPIEDILLERGDLTAEGVWAVYKARERLVRDAKATGRRIGGYEILGTLGEGGLGVVYKARQLSMGRIVALKVLHKKWIGDDEFRRRFLVEARLVGRLSHQNLIQVFDVGRHKDTLYYSMEFVDGETVEDRIEREGRLGVGESLDITIQVTRALEYLHSKEIVHRDVKPGNIMVTKDGTAKLGDFGFVKSSLDSVLSTEGEVLGTPDYISPEAAMGEKNLDFRSDLYSLGASLYHMLTGAPPFDGSSSDIMEAHIKDRLPDLSQAAPEVPDRIRRVVEKLMAKNPKDRHQNFDDLFEDLEQLRLEQGPLASKVKPSRRMLRLLARGGNGVDELLLRERELSRRVRQLLYVTIGLGGGLILALTALVLMLLKK